MANFPNSVTVYATKNPGDTIPSADWDSFGAEITAIEDGLINGTAPINSSNATFNNVTVNGSLSVGAATGRTACTLTHSTNQNVNTGSVTGLNFDTESSDPGSMHSTGSNSSRINFPAPGTYLIGGFVAWNNGSTAGTFRQLLIRVNDVTGIVGTISPPSPNVGAPLNQSVNTLYTPASTNEYATLLVQQDSGSTMSISSGISAVRFWAALIGV